MEWPLRCSLWGVLTGEEHLGNICHGDAALHAAILQKAMGLGLCHAMAGHEQGFGFAYHGAGLVAAFGDGLGGAAGVELQEHVDGAGKLSSMHGGGECETIITFAEAALAAFDDDEEEGLAAQTVGEFEHTHIAQLERAYDHAAAHLSDGTDDFGAARTAAAHVDAAVCQSLGDHRLLLRIVQCDDRADHSAPSFCVLVHDHVFVDLPLGDLGAIGVPFAVLAGAEAAIGVAAEGLCDERILFHALECFEEGARQVVDAIGGTGGSIHGKDVLCDFCRRHKTAFNAVKAGSETNGKSEIRVAGWVRAAQLDACALAAGGWDTDESRAVGSGPGEIDGRFIAWHEAFVGIDKGIGDGNEGAGVGQEAGDEAVGFAGELAFAAFIKEDVAPVTEKGHIGVHAGTVHTKDRLWHKGRMETIALGDGLDSLFEGHDVVGGGEGVGVFEIDLMLAGSYFVVRGFDLKAKCFQGNADLAAGAFAVVEGAEIEVTGFIAGLCGWTACFVSVKEEEFAFRTDVEGITELGSVGEDVLQHVAGIADKRGAVWIMDITDEAGDALVLWPPGQDGEGVKVGVQILVGFVDAGEAFDGAAVDHDLVVQRFFDLCAGDGDVFHLTENVSELHTDEFDIFFFDKADNVFFRIFMHGGPPLQTLGVNKKRARASRRPEHPCSRWYHYAPYKNECQCIL